MNVRSHETEAATTGQPRPGRSELLVLIPLRDWSCAECGESGDFMFLEDGEPHCLDCADLGHLVFLPSGDAALTRRAKKASGLSAVVVRWARARKRYERQGILVEEEALAGAEEHCLADAVVRERRRVRDRERRAREDVVFRDDLAAAIVRLFPRCPTRRTTAIAAHAGARGSGPERVKSGETDSYSDLMSASGVGWLIQATVGSLGGVGRWWRKRAGLAV